MNSFNLGLHRDASRTARVVLNFSRGMRFYNQFPIASIRSVLGIRLIPVISHLFVLGHNTHVCWKGGHILSANHFHSYHEPGCAYLSSCGPDHWRLEDSHDMITRSQRIRIMPSSYKPILPRPSRYPKRAFINIHYVRLGGLQTLENLFMSLFDDSVVTGYLGSNHYIDDVTTVVLPLVHIVV